MKKLSPAIVAIGFILISSLATPKPSPTATIEAEKVVATIDHTITPEAAAKEQPEAPTQSQNPNDPPAPQSETPPAPTEQAKWHDADCEQYRALIARYDWDVPTMMAIMEAESTTHINGITEPCNAQAVGDTTLTYQVNGKTYGYSKSLLQIRQLPGRERCDTDDPEVIIDCGYQIWKSQGYAAWSVTHGGSNAKYLRYLK